MSNNVPVVINKEQDEGPYRLHGVYLEYLVWTTDIQWQLGVENRIKPRSLRPTRLNWTKLFCWVELGDRVGRCDRGLSLTDKLVRFFHRYIGQHGIPWAVSSLALSLFVFRVAALIMKFLSSFIALTTEPPCWPVDPNTTITFCLSSLTSSAAATTIFCSSTDSLLFPHPILQLILNKTYNNGSSCLVRIFKVEVKPKRRMRVFPRTMRTCFGLQIFISLIWINWWCRAHFWNVILWWFTWLHHI